MHHYPLIHLVVSLTLRLVGNLLSVLVCSYNSNDVLALTADPTIACFSGVHVFYGLFAVYMVLFIRLLLVPLGPHTCVCAR
jgi:hypothetical protein